ncbi:MAG TPA: amino acid permease [Gemmatimonadales bacterium]
MNRPSAGSVSPQARSSPHPHSGTTLPRRLGFLAAISVVIGDVIGSGIFRVPAAVASEVGSVSGIMLVWVLGGVITLCGALSLAELAAAMPRAGGAFVYLRETFGPGVAFLFGWTIMLAEPAASAAIALVFAEYLGRLIHLPPAGIKLVAAAAIMVVAAAGYRSARGAGVISSVATVAKVAAIILLVGAAFLLGDGDAGAFGEGAVATATEMRGTGVGLGLVAALWAYTAWHDLSFVAGEVRDPGRTLPRALVGGIVTVVCVYVAANAAYLYVLPFDTLRNSPLVATDAMLRVLGPTGSSAVAAMVMVSTFGALNGTLLVNPRVLYAMAVDGLLFRRLARVHPRYNTPHVSIAVYTVMALVFVWSRSFEQLIESFVLGTWPWLALAVVAMMVLRRRRPGMERPYRTPGYPLVPLVFIAGTLLVVGTALVEHPVTTLAGIGLTLLGVPIYLVRRAAQRRAA